MSGFSRQVRAIIVERAQSYCEGCGWNLGVEAHHRRPRGAGGSKRTSTNQPSNALWLCRPCHGYAEYHRTEAREKGWLVRQHHEPRDIPVLYRGTSVYLDDFGNMHEHPREEAS